MIALTSSYSNTETRRIIPTYCETIDKDFEIYVGVVMRPAKEVILDFGNVTTKKMIAYDDTIFVDTDVVMNLLTSYLKSQNVQFEQARIDNFVELEGKFIINCSGLGAKELNNDPKLESVQGHLITLNDQNPNDLQYMIFIDEKPGITKSGHKARHSFYIMPKHLKDSFPRDVGVIGGSYIVGSTMDTPNEEEFDIILSQARRFYGID